MCVTFICLFFPLQMFAQLTIETDSIKEFELSEVVVTERTKNIDSRGLGHLRINMQQLRVSPLFMGERDVIKTLQFLPGISGGMDGASQINIRGGSSDQTLYLLDDVPVYNQNHTFGLFSVFNADAIQSADVYKGGIPSMYGDKLSGVVSIALKDGNFKRYNHSLSLGILAISASSEGPVVKDKLSYLLTARRSFPDLLYNGLMLIAGDDAGGIIFGFYDINGKLTWKINDKNKLSWQIFTGCDGLGGTNKNKDKYNEKTDLGWKTVTSSLRYTSQLTRRTSLSGSLYYTQLDNFNRRKLKALVDNVKVSTLNQESSLLDEFGARLSLNHQFTANHSVSGGIEAKHQVFIPDYVYKVVNRNKTEFVSGRLGLTSASAYLYDEYRYRNWLFSMGLRASGFNNGEKTLFVVEPRIKVNHFLNANNKVMLAYDRTHQPTHSLNEINYNVAMDFWVPFKEDVLPDAHQISGGWKNFSVPNLTFSLEAYYKRLNNLLLIKNVENYLDFHSDYETGKGRSMGLEAMVEYSKNRLTAWGSYTLSKSTRRFEGKSYPFKYDAPHDFSGFAGYRVYNSKRTTNTLSLNLLYKTGYPYYVPEVNYPGIGLPTMNNAYYLGGNDISSVDFVPNYPNVRLKNYFRTDLNFTMEQKMKRGSRVWQFSLLNLTNHTNPYAVYKKENRSQDILRPISGCFPKSRWFCGEPFEKFKVTPPTRLSILPTIVSKSLVGICHFVGIFLLLKGGTGIIVSIHEFSGKPFTHFAARSGTGGIDKPSHSEGFPAGFPNLNRNLIGCAADSAGFNFDNRLHIIKRLEENFQRILFRFCLKNSQSIMNNAKGD